MNKRKFLKISLSVFVIITALIFSIQTEKATAQTKNKKKTTVSKTKSLCQANEQIIWSCATKKNKIASVCASKDLTLDKGYLQYRYGIAGKIELEAPKSRKESQRFFGYSRYTRPLVTMLALRFENSGYAYEIHDDDNAEEKPPVRAGSIDIFDKNGETVSSVECKLPIKGSLMKLEDIVPKYEEGDI